MSREVEALLFWAGRERFTIDECERLAKDLDAHDSMTFELVGPTGRLPCRWLDAYFGFFVIDGNDGFCSASQFRYAPDIHCENLAWPRDSDRNGEADETRSGSVPEGDRARARQGIAQPLSSRNPTT